MQRRIVCQRCTYYYVTWETNNPHGCKAYGFKSRLIPSLIVRRSSGEDCKLFAEKNFGNRS